MSSTYPYGGEQVRSCQRCGMTLPPNEVYCGNCGYYNALPAANTQNQRPSSPNMPWGGGTPQTSYGQNQYAQQQWGQPPAPPALPAPPFPSAQPVQNNFYGQPPAQPPQPYQPFGMTQAASSPNNFYGTPNQPGTNGNYYGMPEQSANMNGNEYYGNGIGGQQQNPFVSPPMQMGSGFQQGVNGAMAPGYGQQPARQPVQAPTSRKRPNIGLIVGIGILLVVLTGGGLAGYAFIKASQTTASSIIPTVAPPTPTPSVPALFSDSFKDNAKGWNLTGDPGKFSVAVGNGSLVLEDDDNKLLWELLPGNNKFNDMKLVVDAKLSKGVQNNGYGVYIRGASNQNTDLATYYRFELYGDGTFAVFKGVVDATGNSTGSTLVDYTTNSAILKQGSVNHIAIIAKGPSMALIVNGQTLTTVSDISYTSGTVALFVSNLKGSPPGAQATFTHFAIYPPQA